MKPAQKFKPQTVRPLTKSKFKIAHECPTKLFYVDKPEYANKKKEDPFLRALAKGGFQVGKLAQIIYGPGFEVTTRDYDQAFQETKTLLNQTPSTVFEAAIKFENHFIKADIAKCDGTTLELIEVKAKSWSHKDKILSNKGFLLKTKLVPYLYDIAYQAWVAKKAFPQWHIKPYLCLLDKTKTASIDGLNQKFKLVKDGNSYTVKTDAATREELGENVLYPFEVGQYVELIHSGNDAENLFEERGSRNFEEWVQWLASQYVAGTKIPPELSNECKKCEYRTSPSEFPNSKIGFDQCWKDAGKEASWDKPRSFDLWGGAGTALKKSKLYFLDELNEDDIKAKDPKPYEESNPLGGWSRLDRRLMQVEHARAPKDGPRYHADLKAALDLPAPWHFIDFETARTAIPFLKGRRPYEQVAFQFSHHVMSEDGKIEHRSQWLETTPGVHPNLAFVRALKKALEVDNGTVFRYADHENSVLNEIHDQLVDSNEPDKVELIRWIRSLATPTAKNKSKYPDWSPTREFVDLLEYVQWFFWHPMMGGSNSIKVVLPAILNSSDYLKEKYSKPIYGKTHEIKSLNLTERTWVTLTNNKVEDPYSSLGSIFPDSEEDRNQLDDAYGEGDETELRDGGAAMVAYWRLQFSDLTEEQRSHIKSALLRYCELDTLAMAMIWEAWRVLP